jgi:hypothetical protein
MIRTFQKISLDLVTHEDVRMTIKFDVTDELVNTQFAPVAALAAYYQDQNVLEPLQKVVPTVKKSDFSLPNQLIQVLLSILTGCEYLSVVNTRLRPERPLAQLYRIQQFAHQGTLSRTLDGLTLTNLDQLDQAVREISGVAGPSITIGAVFWN